jgi:hydroxyacylglutathione hydrolase
MLTLNRIIVGNWQENCYLLSNLETGDGILIDPGDEADKILKWIGNIRIIEILITHGDADHIGALGKTRSALEAPVGIHQEDVERFGLQADFLLADQQRLEFTGYPIEVAHIPGHTPGSVAFHLPKGADTPLAIVGDAIFPRGPGHTRTPQDLITALEALSTTVFTWEDETFLFPGHGEPTTVGVERKPFEFFRRQSLGPDLFGDVTWREE